MKKAHLSKWRQESTGYEGSEYSCSSEDMELMSLSGDVPPTLEPMVLNPRQISEISSTTEVDLEGLDLRKNVTVKKESENDCDYALDLRTNIRKEEIVRNDCSNNTTDNAQALDLRICNVVSLKGISPVPSCVPDCDNLSTPELNSAVVNKSAAAVVPNSIRHETNQSVDISIPSKMIPIDIIEKFNLIRNLVISSNGAIIPTNIDDPGGMKLEVAQEEIVETSPDSYAVSDKDREQANGYQHILNHVKLGALLLSLKVLSKKCSRRHSIIYLLLIFRENKTLHFLWIVCQADSSHEMVSLIFSEKRKKKKKKCRQLQFWLEL